MAEGRTYIPVIDRDRCSECGVCLDACPATVIPEYREEKDSLRGIIYRRQAEGDHLDGRGTFPHCQQACPVHHDTRGYTQLIAQGRFEDAFSSILDTNPLPAVCGYICHHPCEEACIRGGVDNPIALRLLKRFAAETDMDQKKGMRSPAKLRSEKVLVVGSGPAGLAAANDLALIGYRVTVFEALPVLGGMLTVGIPSFRLPREIVDRDIARIKRLGVEMSENRMFRLDESVEGFSATFLAPGAHKGTRLTIPGAELGGVLSGVQFLRSVNLNQSVKIGRKVAVIGGGNVALDAARMARRSGATVDIYYRRTEKEMPAMSEEVHEAVQEGVNIHFLASPVACLGSRKTVERLRLTRMKLAEVDATGRAVPVVIDGSDFDVDVDTVITAIGQKLDGSALEGLHLTPDGRLAANSETGATSMKGVFAGGDAVTGPGWAIDAIAAGKRAAASIHRYLS